VASWHKVEILLKEMEQVENQFMEKSLQMKTSKFDTLKSICYQAQIVGETLTEVNFSLLLKKLLG
jgi:hypothetical protein